MSIKIQHINASDIDGVWNSIEAWVLNAMGNDKSHTTEDIKKLCQAGKFSLWLVYTNELKGFLMCVLSQAPKGKTAYAPYLGGKDLAEWVAPAFDQFKIYLKTIDCISYSWIGRKAWGKFLKVDSEQSFYRMDL